MTILLGILKWIGFLLIGIIVLVLLILLLILLVPVRYRAQGCIQDKKPDIVFRISWLLHLIHISVRVSADCAPFTVRIAGFSVFHTDFLKKENKTGEQMPQPEAEPVQPEPQNIRPEPQRVPTVPEPIPAKQSKPPEKNGHSPEENGKQEGKDTGKGEETGTKEEEKAGTFLFRIQQLLEKLAELRKKQEQTKEKAERYIRLFTGERSGRAIAFCKSILLRILKSILPRRYRICLHFGMPEKPALMGKILMYLAMLYPFLADHVQLTPDFEEEVLEGSFFFRGRICPGVLAVCAFRIWRNKDVRYFYRHLKKVRENAV